MTIANIKKQLKIKNHDNREHKKAIKIKNHDNRERDKRLKRQKQ